MCAKETMQQQNNGIAHMCAYAMFFLFISSFLLWASFLHHRINQLSVILCCFVIVAFFISLLFSVSQPNVARYMSFERKKMCRYIFVPATVFCKWILSSRISLHNHSALFGYQVKTYTALPHTHTKQISNRSRSSVYSTHMLAGLIVCVEHSNSNTLQHTTHLTWLSVCMASKRSLD